jgi:hypothetical protein
VLQLLNFAKAMVEQRRPWMILWHTDTSICCDQLTKRHRERLIEVAREDCEHACRCSLADPISRRTSL